MQARQGCSNTEKRPVRQGPRESYIYFFLDFITRGLSFSIPSAFSRTSSFSFDKQEDSSTKKRIGKKLKLLKRVFVCFSIFSQRKLPLSSYTRI